MGTNYPRDDDEPSDKQAGVSARAEYRPDEEVPLVITLNVPEHVHEVAGGFGALTDSVRLRPATDDDEE